MTISNQTARTSAVGTGAAQTVSFSFPIVNDSDITVIKREISTGDETALTQDTHYTLLNNGSAGGTITTITPFVSSSYQIHVIRDTAMTQTLDLEQGGTFNADNVEAALDKNTRLIVENSDAIERTLRFPDTDPTSSIDVLPNSIDRASKNLTFDSAGKPTASVSVATGSVSMTAFGTSLVEAADAQDAKVLLNIDHVFDVRDYGATGDGTTDDSAYVDLAIAAAAAAGNGTVYFPDGTYRIEVTDANTDSLVSYKGAGYGTILKANSAGNYALTITGVGNWKKRLISDLKFDGNIAAAREGNGIYLNAGETSCEISHCWFSECDYAIKAVWGMGNNIHDCKFASNNYGWYATSGGTSGHVGDEIFRFNYWTGNRYAAVYINGDGGASNDGYETRFEYDLFELNNFAIYVTSYGFTIDNSPLTIDNIHLEGNGVASGYGHTIDAITPIATYFKDVQNLVINNTKLESYTFDTCRVNTFNCNLNQATWVQTETSSIVTHHSSINSASSGNHFNSYLINPNVFNTSNYGVSYLTTRRTGLTSDHINLVTTGAACITTFTPSATPNSVVRYQVHDGQFGRCIEVDFEASMAYGDSLQIWPFVVTSGKWYVWSYNVKGVGADSSLTVSLTGDDVLHSTHNSKIAVKDGVWQTVSGISLSDASGNDRFFLYNEIASVAKVRFSAVQVVQFDNKNDALTYLEGDIYAMPTELGVPLIIPNIVSYENDIVFYENELVSI